MGKYTGEELDNNHNSMIRMSLGVHFLLFLSLMSIKFFSKLPVLDSICRFLPVDGVFALLMTAFTGFALVPLAFGLYFLVFEFGSAKALGSFIAAGCCLFFSMVGCGLGAQIFAN
ncbi:MAG: hypothetical protein BWY75_01170 [bacterium ADurb.Bin425]|uniref:Uncharacterized protein n=1 Tax=Candidatus Obscuribacter phosphatis TaxID=1906157 RepID=A0A8J7PQR0_9BACT|nr:hypothetical protein [Candidatus Obscuribacter phosphatis]OPZ89425.1 MAG: hypothetical protein BWY75_01170 [bacterium ADurb.Bin425]